MDFKTFLNESESSDTAELVKLLKDYDFLKGAQIKSTARQIIITSDKLDKVTIDVEFGDIEVKLGSKKIFDQKDYHGIEQGIADGIIDALMAQEK
jgi:hypothetical protein